MVSFRILVFVLACNAVFAQASEQISDKKKKVQVASLQTQQQEQLLIPHFSDFADLLEYKGKWLVSDPDRVLTAFEQFKSNQLTEQPNSDAIVEYTLALVDVHLSVASYPDAIMQLDTIVKSVNLSTVNTIRVLEKKAQVFTLQSNLYSAINALNQANELAVVNNLARQAIFTSLLLSESYLTLNQQDKALRWQQQAADLLLAQDDLVILIEASITLAKQQQKVAQHLSATRTLTHVIDLVAKQQYYNVETSLRIQLSNNFMAAQQFVNAELELEKSYNLAVKSRNQQQQLMAIINLIKAYILQGKFDDAASLLKAAQRLERFITSPQDKRDFILIKAQVLAGQSRFTQALSSVENIATSDIVDKRIKQEFDNDLLALKSKWRALSGQNKMAVQGFEELINNKLLQQQNMADVKLNFVMASYQSDIMQAEQQVIEHQKLSNKLELENQGYSSALTIYKVLLFITSVVGLSGGYVLYQWRQPKRTQWKYVDPVTGAHNHSYFVKHVNLLMQNNMPFSLVMFDVDNMRKINQKLGHEFGDRLLTLIVQRLEVRLGSNKLLVRSSGDRFIVIAKNFSLNQAFALAEILRKELNSNKFHVDNLGINLSASFGVTCYYENKTIDSMKDEVQDALNKAKTKGGNITQVVGFC